jgi:hypothetical protein
MGGSWTGARHGRAGVLGRMASHTRSLMAGTARDAAGFQRSPGMDEERREDFERRVRDWIDQCVAAQVAYELYVISENSRLDTADQPPQDGI